MCCRYCHHDCRKINRYHFFPIQGMFAEFFFDFLAYFFFFPVEPEIQRNCHSQKCPAPQGVNDDFLPRMFYVHISVFLRCCQCRADQQKEFGQNSYDVCPPFDPFVFFLALPVVKADVDDFVDHRYNPKETAYGREYVHAVVKKIFLSYVHSQPCIVPSSQNSSKLLTIG